MKYILMIVLMILTAARHLHAQTSDRRYNPQYMWTTFHDDFSGTSLDREVWKPTIHFKRGLGFLIDSPQTIQIRKGNLLLRMKRMPNHPDSLWSSAGWKKEHSDYVGGEVNTLRSFQYGAFECRAKYAHKRGAWPAFWLIGSQSGPCPPGNQGNEIDIAELARESDFPLMMHVIHHYYPTDDCDVAIQKNMNNKNYPIQRRQKYSIFKCIWTPDKIQFFIDNELKHEVVNNNYDWFPSFHLNLVLSQQVLRAYDHYGEIKPKTPQTSHFDWVRVKEFFLAPEITCPPIIDQQATASMDVDSRVTNITWKITPSTLFIKSEGIGKIATINRTTNGNGPGKITYTFTMPSGEKFSAEKNFN